MTMKSLLSLLSAILLQTMTATAQRPANDLISNSSFENVSAVPDCSNELNKAIGWFNPNIGTPDLLTSIPVSANCTWGTPYCCGNGIGCASPRTGQYLVGLHIINQNDKWGEYASIALIDTMIVGRQYYVEFYVYPAVTGVTCGPQGLLSVGAMPPTDRYHIAEPQLYSTDPVTQVYDSLGHIRWIRISQLVSADQPYDHFTIGNFFTLSDPRQLFRNLADTQHIIVNYFIDDVHVSPVITPNLGPDQNMCDNDSLYLDAGVDAASYIWSTGDTTRRITVRTGGTYSCGTGNAAGYVDYDYITVHTLPSPIIDLGRDSAVCSSRPLDIGVSPGQGFLEYEWAPSGYTGDSLYITSYGTYAVTVRSENGCYKSDTITVYEKCPDCITDIVIAPNPVQGDIVLRFSSEYDYPATGWALYDNIGQLCDMGKLDISKGNNNLPLYRNQGVNSGIYVLMIDIPCKQLKFKTILIKN